MSASVNVVGLQNDGMGGLNESLAKFRKHHAEVGDALLNISGIGTKDGKPADKDEPRPAYVHQEYPKQTYHADGRELVVRNDKELRDAQKQAFRTEQYLKPRVHVGDPLAEKKELLDRNRELGGQVSILTEALQRLQQQVEALGAK